MRTALAFSPNAAEPPLRHRCRRPKCGLKIPVPTSNMRNAFCCRGCFTSFYRSRCLVCEQPMQRNRESQLVCDRAKCKASWRRDREHFIGKWGASNGQGSQTAGKAERTTKTSIKTGLKTATGRARALAWRQVAGPSMGLETLRLATIGPERILELERSQKALVEARLYSPDSTRAAEREALYTAAVKRFRDHGWGRPVAAPAFWIPTICNWAPAPNIDPAGVPAIPESLQREVSR